MVKVLLTKTNKVASKVIMAVTKENCSHIALEFGNIGIVCHSNASGVHIVWAKNFRKKNIIVEEIIVIEREVYNKDKMDKAMAKFESKGYDYWAFVAVGINSLTGGLFSRLFPKTFVGISDAYICTEFVAEFFGIKCAFPTTPRQLAAIIKDKFKTVSYVKKPHQ